MWGGLWGWGGGGGAFSIGNLYFKVNNSGFVFNMTEINQSNSYLIYRTGHDLVSN